jgi:phosphohistidine swiveling domain-containing protein
MKNKQYKKLMNRSYPLIFLECWYQGERFGMSRICKNKMHFEPLFIHNQNLGTDVYYNISDEKQNPDLLVDYFENNSRELEKLIDNYRKNYAILKNISKDNKLTNLEKINKIYDISVEIFAVLTSSVVIVNNGNEDKNRKIINLSSKAREDTENFALFSIDALLKESKNILGEKYQDYVNFIKLDEIINKKPKINTLRSRKEGYIFYQGKVYNNPNVDNFLKKNKVNIIKESINKEELLIKGNSAYRGKIKGVVKKVFEVADMDKVKKGDILVTSMTTPDLIAINKNFSAIITDEGGVTCHAAIIAREMKKPCIIGAKIATQVLKDGDLVEVDANKGVVKILKGCKK